MLKLYNLSSKTKLYWETWEAEDGSYVVHWGELGKTGKSKIMRRSLVQSRQRKLELEIENVKAKGFHEFPEEDHSMLMIEFPVAQMGSDEDLEKRHRLEDRMDETLGWTGLGHCDGGSIGSGTMEVCCLVVDFEAAKSVIELDLAGTEFENYSRVYDEDNLEPTPG